MFFSKKRAFNKNAKKGYCIQIFNGSEQDAKKIYTDFQTNYDSIPIFMTYELPDWKIQTNNFFHKLRGRKNINRHKKKYKSARIF